MANKIILKKSSVVGKVPAPGDLEVGELAVNLADAKLYSKDSSGTVIAVGGGGAGAGDVVGPASATDNAVVRYDGTTGKLIQNGLVTIDDNGNVANVNSIGFDTTPATLPTGEGTMFWDADKGAVAYVMQGGDVTQEIGESQYMYIQASANITKGQVVMFTGAVGGSGIPTGAPASGVTDGSYIMGIAAEAITSGTSGFVQTFGVLKPINITAFATGDILWYDPSVAGGLTKTKPSAPNVKVQVAAVTAGASAGGAIFIRVTAGSELGATDSNVLFGSLASGNLLVYNATAGYWVNANLTAGTGVSVTNGAGSVTIANTDLGSSQNIFKNVAVSGQSTIVADGNDDTLTVAAGTGITLTTNGTTDTLTVTNSAPDQTVALTGAGGISISGTYPNFTITGTTYSLATSTVAGLVELGSDTVQSVSANAVTATASRSYALQLNSAGQGVINVPWTDTTYSAGNGISLSGTTFSVAAGTGLTQDASGLSLTAITAGDSTVGAVRYNGTTNTAGQFYGGTTTPNGTTRLNYSGYFYPTFLNLIGSSDTTTAATHYFVETGSDGFVRPKTLANVRTEIVTQASIGSAIAPSTSGNVLTSNGTSWISAAPVSGSIVSKMIYDNFTATAGQTTFTTSNTYTSGKIDVYANGVRMVNGSDVTVTSGTSVVFATGLTAGTNVNLVYPI